MRLASEAVVGYVTLLAGLFTCTPSIGAATSPPVNIRLRAPWEPSPLLLEAFEAAAAESPPAFHPLVAYLGDLNRFPESFDESPSSQQVYEAFDGALKHLGLLQEPGARSNWDLALALHSQSPKIEAFWHLARTTGADARWAAHVSKMNWNSCGSWVDWYGQVVCDPAELDELLETVSATQSSVKVPQYPFDHVLESPDSPAESPTAVFYARPLSSNFVPLYSTLHTRATQHNVYKTHFRFILRWAPLLAQNNSAGLSSGFLAGYGAALDLKKVDYLVIDDRILSRATGAPTLEGEQIDASVSRQLEDREWVNGQLIGSRDDETVLADHELSDIGLKSTQAIIQSADPVRFFTQLTQDFPLHCKRLARSNVTPTTTLQQELQTLQRTKIRSGFGEIWLNGKPLATNEQFPLGLLKVLRSERGFMASLMASPMSLSADEAVELLSLPSIGRAQSSESENQIFFDASDRIERQEQLRTASKIHADGRYDEPVGAITWWNNVETDAAFSSYSPSIKSLLRPTYPGQLPRIRRNLWNVVFVLDLSSRDACNFIAQHLMPAASRVGLHFGFVPAGLENSDAKEMTASTVIARLYWHLLDEHGIEAASHFLSRLSSSITKEETLSIRTAQKAFTKALAFTAPLDDHSSTAQMVSQAPNARESAVRSYTSRLRLTKDESLTGHLLVNGQLFPFVPQTAFQLILQVISVQTQLLARPIHYDELTDNDDVSTYFYDLPASFVSRSELVFPRADVNGSVGAIKVRAADLAVAWQDYGALQGSPFATFIYPTTNARINTTVWLVGNLDSRVGVSMLRQTCLAQINSAAFRLGLVHLAESNPDHKHALMPGGLTLSSFLGKLSVMGQLNIVTPQQLLKTLEEVQFRRDNLHEGGEIITEEERQESERSAAAFVNEAGVRSWNIVPAIDAEKHWQSLKKFVASLGIDTDKLAIVVNGRVISNLESLDVKAADIETLVKNEQARRIDPVAQGLISLLNGRLEKLDIHQSANAIAIVSSVVSTAYLRDEREEGMFVSPVVQRTNVVDRLGVEHSRFEVGDRSTARLRFQAVVDPLTEVAQRWSALFKMITELPDSYLEVILNPVRNVTEVPLKRFYRYSTPTKLSFVPKTGAEVASTLSFQDMPEDAVLTMGLDAPPAWLTMASAAVYDLDNIRLRDVPADGRVAGIVAVYDLKHLIIEGHCREGQEIPRGLQLELQTPDGSETLDTIVMANLAYFQFRARPGLYRLRIREGGKSNQVYKMVSVGNLGWNSPDVDVTGDDITLDSLDGLTIYPRVERRPGMEHEELLLDIEGDQMVMADYRDAPPGKNKGLFQMVADGVKKMVGSPSTAAASSISSSAPKQADINIFTVASGHLYERMTYIMILSVLRHTKSSIKFWFIENFLSPSFKEFIPHLSREYGFEYELVTYAWPHWLRRQKEKQRTIWGYKILFLDVLFPLDLNKVIFVDSDQVVRHDLKELAEFDLKGAPYGFPPMGDDSYDMDGYRFWKRGYWKDFLQGRPYHISALYVVDLTRFRSVAAGDRLRGQYQALSQDPGSLANLDQDLPQTLMFQLPIRTLDKTWLWCETWCSHDWLDQAKTIDLCSNPKTHEAKLDRARRQIPEWTELDDEVQRLAASVSKATGRPIVAEGNCSNGEGAMKPASSTARDSHHEHDEL